MPHEVRLVAHAQAEIDENVAWLLAHLPESAQKWHVGMLEKLLTLQDHPERCPLADEATSLGIELRELLFGKRRNTFRILFTIDGNTVNVLHVRRAFRDALKLEDS
jgi:plasmid stabilization system protein ParE